jgi:hypothetical protein
MEKFITNFDTTAELATFSATTDFGRPHVSLTKDDSKIHYFEDPYKGHQYVDLGLPSGTKWATMNVGASSETDYGNYYQYGKGAAQYAATSGDSNYGGTEDPLDSSVDTASQVWGGSWHMPTKAQMQELTANTTYQWVTNYKGSGINGGTFTATNGAVLFIPAAGYWYGGSQGDVGKLGRYWGSSPYASDYAYILNFISGNVYWDKSNYRYDGFAVRAVRVLQN